MRRGLIAQLALLLVALVVVGFVLTTAMCGRSDEKTPSPVARVTVGSTHSNPASSPGMAGGHRIPVRRMTAAELGYSDTPPVQEEVVSTTLSNSLLAEGGSRLSEIERLERELAAAKEEVRAAEAEARRLREQAALWVPPLAGGGSSSTTLAMDSAEWMETGWQDIPESPAVLHCGRKPPGYRYADSDRYLHRFTADGPFLVFIDGEWSRATGQTEDLWVDLGTVRGEDGRQHVRRKLVTFCREGSVGYVRPDPSVEVGEVTLLMFGENVGSARGVSYLGGESWGGLWASRPSSLECTLNVCLKDFRGSRQANRYFRWLQRTYTPHPGDVAWAEE